MAEIVNLRMARKARKRADHTRKAEANRADFGRTRGERASAEHERERMDAALDGAKLEKD